MITVPAAMHWWRREPGGAGWLDALPGIVEWCARRWRLEVGEPFEYGKISLVVPCRRADGTDAVLKVNFPEPDGEFEADALSHWGGDGAVFLYEADQERRALLEERCHPGTPLWEVGDDEEATHIAANALARLWRHGLPGRHRFRLLSESAGRWAVRLGELAESLGPRVDADMVRAATAWLQAHRAEPADPVVLHQDFHGGNVLRAAREAWLVIDPKPLAGDRAFDVASLVRDRREVILLPGGERMVERRLAILERELGLDREAMRMWTIAHALAWDLYADEDYTEPNVQAAHLLWRL